MAKATILTGARAQVYIGEKLIGLFANCSWSIRQDKSPAYILGKFNPDQIVPTAQEPVSLSLTGYRVIEKGPYTLNATKLKGLLSEQDFTVTIKDRDTSKVIFTANGCRITGWSSGVSARGQSDIRLDVIGLVGWDESSVAEGGDNDIGASSIEGT